MLRVAIVGNIASGKSVVEDILLRGGFSVLDTDKLCHYLLGTTPQIVEDFGNFDIFVNENISRDKLGKIIFNSPELKKKLEDILYPLVRKGIDEFFLEHESEQVCFVAIPLLFESGMEDLFDKIVFVYAEDDIRKKRLMQRNNYSAEYAQIRMDAQLGQQEKINKADFVIYNNSTLKNLELQVENFLLKFSEN